MISDINQSDARQLNKFVMSNIRITSQETMLLKCLEKFYNADDNGNRVLSIINSNISIRLIDFFVTNYSKNNKIVNNNNLKLNTTIYSSYKSQLKAYNKKYFDPFSRGDRIPFFINDCCIITTIGQLNFMKWYIENKLYNYVKNNYNKIEVIMNKSSRTIKKKYNKNKIIKKKNNKYIYNNIPSLSLCDTKKYTDIIVNFD